MNSALNFILKERAGEGIGSITTQAEVTPDQIRGVSGSDTPKLLGNTVLFGLENCFALRAGQEHRNLRMKISQLLLHTDESGAEHLQYVKVSKSKSNNGCLAHLPNQD